MKQILFILALFVCGPAFGQSSLPFQPFGGANTKSIAVTGTAQTLTCDTLSNNPHDTYRFQVRDTTTGSAGPPVTVALGITGGTAPTAAVVGTSMEMVPNSVEVFTAVGSLVVSVISTGTGSTFRCTAGAGQ